MITVNTADVALVWDVATGKEQPSFQGPKYTSSIAFSPDGKTLAGGGLQGTIHFWEVATRQTRCVFQGNQGWIHSVAFSPDGRLFASGGADSTALLWDLAGGPPTEALSAADLDQLWTDLTGDSTTAYRALWRLALAPKQSLPMLKLRLQSKDPADADKVAKLVTDLDSKNYAVRQKAANALDDIGEAAEPALRKTLGGNIPLEVRQRIEQMLEKRDKEVIRKLRAIETLEHIGTAEARQVLQDLAKCAPNPKVAEAAAASLLRLGKRASGMP
jgi:HEAT repeat protein